MKLLSILQYLFPRAIDDGDGPDEPLDALAEDPAIIDDGLTDVDDEPTDPNPDEDPEADPDSDTDTAPARPSRASREVQKLRSRAQAAEKELERVRAAQAPPQSNTPSDEALQWQQEEQRLRNAEVSELEKWQINANRVMRQNTRESQAAKRAAEDTSDQTAFKLAAAENPRLKRFEAAVEKELTGLRSRGGNAPRKEIAYYLLGKAVAEGKLKPKAESAPKSKSVSAEARGKTPGARSDVSAKSTSTESAKRRARLENITL